jgi:hypothetical protein
MEKTVILADIAADEFFGADNMSGGDGGGDEEDEREETGTGVRWLWI